MKFRYVWIGQDNFNHRFYKWFNFWHLFSNQIEFTMFEYLSTWKKGNFKGKLGNPIWRCAFSTIPSGDQLTSHYMMMRSNAFKKPDTQNRSTTTKTWLSLPLASFSYYEDRVCKCWKLAYNYWRSIVHASNFHQKFCNLSNLSPFKYVRIEYLQIRSNY